MLLLSNQNTFNDTNLFELSFCLIQPGVLQLLLIFCQIHYLLKGRIILTSSLGEKPVQSGKRFVFPVILLSFCKIINEK